MIVRISMFEVSEKVKQGQSVRDAIDVRLKFFELPGHLLSVFEVVSQEVIGVEQTLRAHRFFFKRVSTHTRRPRRFHLSSDTLCTSISFFAVFVFSCRFALFIFTTSQ